MVKAWTLFNTHYHKYGLFLLINLPFCPSETLRVYPPAGASDRKCTKDYKLPGTELIVKKGQGLLVPIYAMQHDPEYFPEPEKFNPERFSKENEGNIVPYTYIPFGSGPRNCIGN